ncbi:hypothetical protein CH373_04900 [Leptospira perolatii]|uniref:Tetratricopeptide repeat protein n=1 Tax=Leptospira perolatii TaxID=2023191 RepID=A0A2M9ZQM1_9LEPT|nr:hypothetical protein [Leptospira perolatii]PJZ70415.1 hypothetical protein CH360_05320 [Leptospira perolatii]PJZ74251.1 hypothetical protein CH373_04900 [Leptospira perolatii]
MNRNFLILAIFVLSVFFILIAEAILSIKMLELRVQLTKSQIMNYEFSSEVLKHKFRQMLGSQQDITQEIYTSAMESRVLNSDILGSDAKLGINETIGLGIVNLVRKLSLKSFLKLSEDHRRIVKLQFAFLMEKNQLCKIASEKYSELEEEFSGSGGDDLSFVYLHNAYCIALLGDQPKAIQKLEEILRRQPGTHFAESASILISVLRESSRQQEEINSSSSSELEKARALYLSGQYALALDKFNILGPLSVEDSYMKTRSTEKLGDLKSAVLEYSKLASQRRNLAIAKESNRRLMLIGAIYGGGAEITKTAEENALKLNDKEILEISKAGAALQQSPVVVQNIKRWLESPDNKKYAEEALSLNKQIKEFAPALLEEKAPAPKVIKPEETARIVVKLSDGRNIRGVSFSVHGSELSINNSRFDVSIPYSVVTSVTIDSPPSSEAHRMDLSIKNEQVSGVISIARENDSLIVKTEEKELRFKTEDLKSAILH